MSDGAGPLDGIGPLDGRVPLEALGSADGAVPDGAVVETVRVLLVDDHEDLLGVMRMMMERRSYSVATALSGAEALEVAPGFAPHVVVSDIGMPGMDGYEMMSALRALDGQAPFKSIALSGYEADGEAERAQAAGYDAQLTKPVDFDSLFQTIDSFSP